MSKATTPVADFSRQELDAMIRKIAGRSAPAVDFLRPASTGEPIPASFAQRRLWFLDRLEPGSAVYNVPVRLRLEGALDVAALARALAALVSRHESLRTRFAEIAGEPFQVVEPPAVLTLPGCDLDRLDPEDAAREAARQGGVLARRPFDLARGPLLRCAWLRLGPACTDLVLVFHHTISDGWSLGIALRELGELYNAFAAGRPAPLAALPVQFADHARAERRRAESAELARGLERWCARLEGLDPLVLPADHPPAARGGATAGTTLAAGLPRALTEGLGRLAGAAGTTLFTAVLAAFQALLGRLAGASDLAVGVPVAGRRQRDHEGSIGCFVNLLVVRARLGDDPSFGELLRRTRETVLDAQTDQDVPFELLVERLRPERSLTTTPLVQAVLVFQNAPASVPRFAGLSAELAAITTATAKFDLTLDLAETAAGLAGTLESRRALFDPSALRRWWRHFETLAAAAAAAPERRLSELPLLGAAERWQLLAEVNDTGAGPAPEIAVHALFVRWVAATPDAIAAVAPGAGGEVAAVSYRALHARARRLAGVLRRQGVGAETRVAILAERGLEMLVATVAVLAAGGVYVPLDPAHPAERLAFQLADAGVETILVEERWRVLLPPEARGVVAIAAAPVATDAVLPAARVHAGQLVYVMYTSGSTGRPKGVAVCHRGVVRLVAGASFARLDAGTVFLHAAPPAFDAATLEIWGPLANGGRVVVAPPGALGLDTLAELVERQRVDSAWLTAGLFHALVEAGLERLRGLRQLLAGGDVLSPPHVARALAALPATRLINGYGPTENTTFTCCWPIVDVGEPGAAVPIGRPIGATRAHALDRRLAPVPIGVAGQLATGGAGLARGYLGRPALSAAVFVPDPWPTAPGERLYLTGDLVRRAADGRLEFLGRIDRQVKIRGFRIEPAEVEAVLAAEPEVSAAAVIVAGADGEEKRLVAFVVVAPGVAPGELRARLAARLPAAQVPAAVLVLETLPLTANGKLDRAELARLAAAPGGRSAVAAGRPPSTPTEQILAGSWAELLGVESVGADDDFFALGGHSLLAARLMARVRESFGVAIELRALFEASTLAGLAERIEAARRGPATEIPPLVRRPRDADPLPASFAQERMWFLDRLEPGGARYNLAAAVRLDGGLAVAALHGALAAIVRRHEALRTHFAEVDGEPVQVIAPGLVPALPQIDLAALGTEAGERCALELAHAEAARPFVLACGPLWRALLVRLGPDRHGLVLTLHHAVSDGWSVGVLVRELGAFYASLAAGEPAPLPALPVQYPDFALWQRSWLTAGRLEHQLAYWRGRLAGLEPLELPADRPRHGAAASRGAELRRELPAALLAGLERLGRERGATFFMVLLAAFQGLLGRITGQDDFTVGTPIAGRVRPGLEGLIGFFVNTLVLRAELADAPVFSELLARVRRTTLDAFEHQDVPFERLVEALRPRREAGRNPLFQVTFALQNTPFEALSLPGLTLEQIPLPPAAVRFELELSLEPRRLLAPGEGRVAVWSWEAQLFDRTRIERLARHFETWLAEIVADPGRRVCALALLGVAERHQLLVEWNPPGDLVPGDLVPGDLVAVHLLAERQAVRAPDAVALVSPAAALTRGELERRAECLARRLIAAGVGAESVVAIVCERSLELVVAMLAVLKSGGAYLPIDPAQPAERIAFALDDGGARWLLAGSRRPEGWPEDGRLWLDIASASALEAPAVGVAGPRAAADNLAYVIYTSGSTGRPKGVLLRHGGLVNLILWHLRMLGTSCRDRTTLVSSPIFDATTWDVWTGLAGGATICLPPAETLVSPPALVEWLVRERVNVSFLPTPLAEAALHETSPGCWPLRALLLGADRLRHVPAGPLPFMVYNCYGPTEITVLGTVARVAPGAVSPPIGRPVAGYRALLLDRRGRLMPIGVVGEINLGGLGLARGYLGRPGLTAERFVPDALSGGVGERLYRSGDLGRLGAGGEIDFLGRSDRQIKIRGFRVEPGEVEVALAAHPGVGEVVVVARQDRSGPRLVAYLVAPMPAPAVLRGFLERRLPSWMLPAVFVEVEALPRLASGKVDRAALPIPAEREGSLTPPRTPTEELVAGLWCELLGIERVAVEDDFFALGGHSLLASRLVARLREHLGVELELRVLFERSTLEALSATLDAARRKAPAAPVEQVPVARPEPLPLSFAQERMWFLDQLEPGSASYHLPAAVQLAGDLRPELLHAALAAVVRRHEALRTRFVLGGDGPVQRIAPALVPVLPQVDLAALGAAERERCWLELAAVESARPFDLSRGPLLRALLLRLGPRHHGLVLTLHHAVSDGWSIGVLVRELGAFYSGLAAGEPVRLPALPVHYADFAVWQRTWLAGERLERQLGVWRERLAGLGTLELPSDRPRTGGAARRGAQLLTQVAAARLESLEALGRAHGATLFMVLLAAYQTSLGRLSGSGDLAVGTPIAGRVRPELEGLIGLFVNTLVLRARLGAGLSFAALLAATRHTTLEAFDHQDVPFERLVEELRPRREPGRNPLFQVAFALQNAPFEPLRLPGVTLERVELPRTAVKFELGLTAVPAGPEGAMELVWSYDPDLFDATRIARLARSFGVLLGGVCAAPEQRLGELPVLAAAERQQLLVEWNAAEPSYPVRAQLGLHELVLARAAERPEAVAVVDDVGVVSYAELARRAGALAGKLRALGVGPERLVAVRAERSPEMVAGMLGALMAGAAYLPIDPEYPAERVERLLAAASRHAGPPVVLTRRTLAEPHHGLGGAAVRPDPANPAYVLFTSGSTGEPKGVVISHRAVVGRLSWVAEREPPESFLHKTSIGFDLSVVEIFGTLAAGGRLVLARPGGQHDPGYLLERIRDERVSDASFLPAHFQMLLDRGGLEQCRSLVRMMTGGEAVPPDLPGRIYAQLPVALHNRYGPTETTISVTSWKFARGRQEASSPIGRPIAAARVYVVDAALRPVMLGAVGEIAIGGVCLARGYLGRPGESAASFVPDGLGEKPGERLYRSGDLGRFRADGALEFLGRRDGQVKVRGFRIELGEVEAVARRCPGVEAAVVLARELRGERALVAFVAGVVAAEALRAFVGRALPDHMVPAQVVVLDRLPLGASGKVDRAALDVLPLPEEHREASAPRTPVEELVAALWAEVLGCGRPGIHDDFFALGGHSLAAARVVSRLRRELGVEVPLRELFEAPTVLALAARVEHRRRAAAGLDELPLAAWQGAGEPPLSFAQERLWFLDRLAPGRAEYNVAGAVRLLGELDVAVLAAGLGELARRQASLRTSLPEVGGRPVQRIAPARPGVWPLLLLDLSALRDGDRALRFLLGAEARRGFELARGPLVRFLLVRVRAGEHVLFLNLHHAISDGWSLGVLVRELGAVYAALRAGRPSPLAPLGIQYRDYAAWQRLWLAGEVLERQLGYWREGLAGAPAALELPADRPRPKVRGGRGGAVRRRLGGSAALAALGRERGATLFMVLLAGFAALVLRLTHREDVVVGTPIAGRTRPELEELVGFFVNTLVLRTDLGGDPSFGELVGRVRETALGAFLHQDVPFEKLVEALRPERDTSRTPLVQVIFGLQNAPFERVLPGLVLEPLEIETGSSKLDLTVSVIEREGELVGGLEYDADLFDRTTIERLARQFGRLLEGVTAAARLWELPLLGAAERQQLAVEHNATAEVFELAPLHVLVARRAARSPEAVAVVFEDEALSYGELVRSARRLARQLHAREVGAEVFVGVAMERSLELMVALLGVLEAGAAYVPLEPSLPEARRAAMVEELRRGGGEAVVVTAIDARTGEGAALGAEVDLDGAAYAIYTSGSTGRPKGVVNSHRGVANRLLWAQSCFGLGPDDTVLQKTPFSFDVSVWELFWPLLAGSRLEMARPGGHRDPAYLAAKLDSARITTTHFVPSMLVAFLEAVGERCFPALRRVLTSGEALSPELAARFMAGPGRGGVELHNLYGPTEAAIDVSWWRCPAAVEISRVPIGRPTANVVLHVLDRALRPVPSGVVGELQIGGVQVARGYLGRPGLTAERFVPDPFGAPGGRLYKTGDRTRWLVSGEVEYLGRLDHQVKIRGLRIELGEIEAVLCEHAGVREAAVTVHGGDRLVGWVVARGELDLEDLRAHLARRLPAYMVPAVFEQLAALPSTVSGKLDRGALPEPGLRAASAGFMAPRTALEEVLAGAWAEVLGVERVGIEESFFELGGHSILATRVMAWVRETFAVDVPLAWLFERPTLLALAAAIERDPTERARVRRTAELLLEMMGRTQGEHAMSTMGRGLFRLSAGKKELLRARLEAEGLETGGLAAIRRRPRRETWPLSFSQQRLWFLDQLAPGLAAYNLWEVLSLAGALRPAALAAALGEVERRHEVLRARFKSEDGQPLQTIAPPRVLEIPLVDLRALAPAHRESAARRLLAAEIRRSFDLARGPLLRALLLRLAPERHLALLAVHHVATDGWSMGVMIEEVGALYRAFTEGHPPKLPPLAIDYADYAAWQREWLAGPVYARQLDYWKRQLADLPTVVLPTDRPRPAVQTHHGGACRRTLAPEPSHRLVELGREQGGATLFMVLLAAFYTLLYRTTGQRDLVVGSPIANRQRAEVAPLVGFFVNTLVLRTRLEGGWSFRRLLEAVREVAVGAYGHQDLPFEKLVEELAPERDLSHVPLFQLMFALQNTPRPALDLAGLKLERFELDNPHAPFDLTLVTVEVEGGLLTGASYNTDLFDGTRIRRLLGHLHHLLAAVTAEPDRALDALPLMSAAERHQLLAEWSAVPPAPGLPDVLARTLAHAAARPEAIAVVAAGEVVLSWGELEARSGKLAAALGGGREAVVALLTERSPALVLGALAALRAGAAYLPMDPAQPPERLAYMAVDAGVALVLAAAADAERLRTAWVEITSRPFPRVLDPEQPPAGGALVSPDPEPAALAYVIYTSGSTGKPKGTELVHAGLCNLLAWHLDAFALAAGERATLVAAPGFDASVWELWAALAAGAELHVPPAETLVAPAALVRWLAERRIDVSFLPTPLAEAVLAEPVAARLALRWLLTGGDRLRAAPAPGLPFRLANQYGPTETTVVATWGPVTPGEPGAPAIGRPLPGFVALLLDRSGRPVPLGVPGELCLGGIALARGYRRRPGLSAERFIPDALGDTPGARLYRTGDLARWRADGRLDFLGRIDHQVKVRGFRIELGEIETALGALPAVHEAAVVVRRDLPGGALAGFVVARGEGLESAAVSAELRRCLPDYMVPAQLLVLAELPRTAHGKLDRAALLRLAAAAPQSAPRVAPRTPAEQRVATIFGEVLGIDGVDARGHFFELGGHSLLAAKVVSRLAEAFGVEVALKCLFEAPVVEALAARLAARSSAGAGLTLGPIPPRGAGEIPLSFAQERLWFLEQLEPGTAAYNLPMAVRLRGRLAPAALAAAFAGVVARHEGLRSRFLDREGRPWVEILPPEPLPLPLADLAGLAESARSGELADRLRAEAGLPFDLARGGLVRALLLRLAPEEHVVAVSFHHAVTDGWSMDVFTRELAALYQAAAAGTASPLAPLPVQYPDFAAWQRRWLQGEALETQLGWWRERLGGELPTLALPLDRARPDVQSFRGERLARRLGPETLERLVQLGRERGATLFMTLIAAFSVLLGRLSGQRDLLIGVPSAGRTRREIEGLIGFFINTLVLRADLSGEPSFETLLAQVRETALGAFAHQDVPFEKLVAELHPNRDLSRTPLFQVFFNLLNFERGTLALGEVELEPLPVAEAPSKFDLTLYAAEDASGLGFFIVYNADLFTPERMAALADAYVGLLEQIARDPTRAIDAYSLRHGAAGADLPDPLRPMAVEGGASLPELFLRTAGRVPERLAVADGRVRWSYAELERASAGVAAALVAAGVGAGQTVAICAERGAWLVAAVLGVGRAGAVFVILDPGYPAPRLAEIAAQARPALLLEIAPAPAELAGLRRLSLPLTGESPVIELPPPSAPDDLAYLAFTSGSTGKPKGILGTHRPVAAFIDWYRRRFDLGPSDRFAMLSGLAHDPLLRDLFTPLALGAELHVPPPETMAEPAELWRWLRHEAVTVAHLTPSLGEFLLQGAESDASPLSELKLVLLTGEAVRYRLVARLRERMPAALVVNVYGATETPQVIACHLVEGVETERRDGGLVPIGCGRDAVDLLVLDARGELCAVGEVGEIHVRSPYLAQGYLDDEAATRERFLPGGADGVRSYRTGDLGRYRPGGEVEFAGRADTQVKVRGYRVEPAEVEAVLVGHAEIAEAVALALEAPNGEPRLVAWVVPAAGASPEPETLHGFLRAKLPDYMVPAHVVTLAALPLTPNRKLDRRALPAPDWQRGAAAETALPRTPVEAQLAEIWSELLGVERVGVHDDFFALGGHSLLATRLAAKVHKVLGASLPLRRLFQAPTVAALAAWLESEEGRLPQPEVPLLTPDPARLGEPFPMTDIQQAYWLGRSAALELGNVATHSYVELDCTGFDLDRFTIVWRRLIERHAMLRAVMLPDGRQRILEQVPPYELRVEDLRDVPAARAEAVLAEIRAELSHQVLDPERWPIFELRATLLPGDVVRLHVSRDALLYDAWSTHLLGRDLLALYRNPEARLEPLELSFRDYVLAEHALREGELWARSAAYWRERLETLPPAPELPLAADPASLGRPVFERRTARLEPELWSRLQERARAAGLTPSVVLLAAYSEVLASWSKSLRFTLNLTLFNRLPVHPQVERVVGDFTSVTLLAIDAAGAGSLVERARAIQQQLWNDLDHRYVGGVWVMRELARRRPGRLRAAMPLVFTSTLGLRRGTAAAAEEALGRPVFSITQTPQVWLDHQVGEMAGALGFNWDSVAGLFPRGMIDAMFGAYVGLLHALALEEGAWTTRERCLTPAEQLELRDAVNATAAPVPAGLLHEPFLARAARRPEAPAVIAPERTLGYGELAALSNALGRRLRALGVGPGQLVAVVMEKGWEQVAAVLGVLEAGGAYLPIDAAVPPERLALLLESGEVRAALTQPKFAAALAWPAGVEVIAVVPELAAETGTPLAPAQRQDDLAYVIYTSGSTGKPKGVAIDHRGALNTIVDVNTRFGVGAEDRVLALSALNFDLSVWDVFGVLAAGGAIVLPEADERRDPAHWAELARRHRVTVWNSVPALAEMFVEHLALDPAARLEQLRLVLLSGDWIPITLPDRLRRLAPAALVSLGGATEASIWSILYPIAEVDSGWRSIPYGRAMLNQSFHVLDEAFRPRPVWVPGELFIGGVGLAQGYFKDPEKTAASFVQHPQTGERLYRTGDLGRFLPDGTIEFLGREDLQVKVQGHRIELGEIEAALERCPALRAAVVLAAGEARGPRRLVAFVVAAEGAAPDADAVRGFLATKLPAYMVPAVIVFLDQLPLSANGKVDRGALATKAQHAGDLEAAARYVAPRTELEAELAAAWAEVLKLERVGVEENFFELGGDSIAAIQLSTRLAKAGLRVRPTALFEHQTVAALATVVEKLEPEQEAAPVRGTPLVEIQPGAGRALFCIHPAGGNVLCYRELARALGPGVRVCGLEARGLRAGEQPLDRVEAMAEIYLEAVRALQPAGPYALLGWSLGGLVAYEMACRLAAAGEPTRPLVLVDAQRLSPGRHLPTGEAELLAAIFDGIAELDTAQLAGRDGDARLIAALEKAGAAGVLPAGFGLEEARRLLAVFRTGHEATAAYVPRRYGGSVVVVKASDAAARGEADASLGWAELVDGELVVCNAPGSHQTMLSSPHVQELARRIGPFLAEILPERVGVKEDA